MQYQKVAYRQAHANTRKHRNIKELQYLEALAVIRKSSATDYPDKPSFPLVVRALLHAHTL